MILSADQVEQIRDRLGIDPVPGDYPGLSELQKVFGDHSFYLTADGLHVWEYANAAGGDKVVAVKVASWANEEKSDLGVHTPEVTDVTVDLAAGAGPPATANTTR
ncbi:MAG: hypothetical protein ACE5GT_05880 [Rhodospirillales bacterium]